MAAASKPLKPSPRIVRNSARCLICGDHLESRERHDRRTCSCGNLTVDGGRDYLRRLERDPARVEDTSITEESA
jgi:hypothetical protein